MEGCPPHLRRLTPAAAVVWPQPLELWKVASRDWIKTNYVINNVPCHLILDARNIVYAYESTNVFRGEFLYTVTMRWQVSICIYSWHICPSWYLPLSFVAALVCHRCKLKMNLHARWYCYNTDAYCRRKPRGNLQSCGGYSVCFGIKCIVLCQSHGVANIQNGGGVITMWGKAKRGVGWKKGYIYSRAWHFLVQLMRCDRFDWCCALCWLTNTKQPRLHIAHPPCTWWIRSLKRRFITCRLDTLWLWVLLFHQTSLLPLRDLASQSKPSSSQIVPTV